MKCFHEKMNLLKYSVKSKCVKPKQTLTQSNLTELFAEIEVNRNIITFRLVSTKTGFPLYFLDSPAKPAKSGPTSWTGTSSSSNSNSGYATQVRNHLNSGSKSGNFGSLQSSSSNSSLANSYSSSSLVS